MSGRPEPWLRAVFAVSESYRAEIFPSGHFFLTESPEPILDAVRAALSR